MLNVRYNGPILNGRLPSLSLHSYYEYARNPVEPHVPLPCACHAVASGTSHWIYRSGHDTRQDNALYVERTLLRLLLSRTYLLEGGYRVLDTPKWVSCSLSDVERI